MKHRKKIALLLVLVFVMVGVLTACAGADLTDLPEGTYAAYAKEANELVVVSYNIRVKIPFAKADDKWGGRKEALVAHIRYLDPDVIGLQEVNATQLKYLKKNLSDYSYVGRSRGSSATIGEGAYIFYKTARLQLVDSEYFWLSETPNKSSKGWDAECKRIVVAATLKDNQTGKSFTHYNTHLDHAGQEAREKGLALLLNRIQGDGKKAAILTGDFNFDTQNPLYTTVASALDDTFTVASEGENRVGRSGGTFHNFGKKTEAEMKTIDFIFVQKDAFDVRYYDVIKEKFGGVYTSDHYAVLAVLSL